MDFSTLLFMVVVQLDSVHLALSCLGENFGSGTSLLTRFPQEYAFPLEFINKTSLSIMDFNVDIIAVLSSSSKEHRPPCCH
jgi:hypothetical protein